MQSISLLRLTTFTCVLFGLTACKTLPSFVDRPRLTAKVRLMDVNFQSSVLGRTMHLRLIVPKAPSTGATLPVVYLLHGAGVNFRDWANNSDISSLAEHGVVLVMPDAEDAYYIDESSGRNRGYEDFFIHEIVPEVHRLVPEAANDREHTAVAGISRGGFGAVILGMRHPGLFSFVGDISGALDLPERRFSYRSPLQSFGLHKAFGSADNPIRQNYDPFPMVRKISAQQAPYFFVSCGDKDSLFGVNARFAALLGTRSLPHEFHTLGGGHSWNTWNEQMPLFEAAVLSHFDQRSGLIAR